MDNNDTKILFKEMMDAMMKDLLVKMQPTLDGKRNLHNMLVAADNADIPLEQFTTWLSEFAKLDAEGKSYE